MNITQFRFFDNNLNEAKIFALSKDVGFSSINLPNANDFGFCGEDFQLLATGKGFIDPFINNSIKVVDAVVLQNDLPIITDPYNLISLIDSSIEEKIQDIFEVRIFIQKSYEHFEDIFSEISLIVANMGCAVSYFYSRGQDNVIAFRCSGLSDMLFNIMNIRYCIENIMASYGINLDFYPMEILHKKIDVDCLKKSLSLICSYMNQRPIEVGINGEIKITTKHIIKKILPAFLAILCCFIAKDGRDPIEVLNAQFGEGVLAALNMRYKNMN